MKKSLLILLLLEILYSSCTLGQEINKNVNKDWSISLTFAPLTTFYYYDAHAHYLDHYSKGITEVIYPHGCNLIVDHRINNRIFISSGFSFKTKRAVNNGGGADINYFETSTEKKYIFEIPVTFKYYFSNTSRFFNPYLNTGLRNTFFKRAYVGEFTEYTFPSGVEHGKIDKHEGKYFLFANLGLGIDLRLLKSLSLVLESNLTYSISGFGYLEGQGGIKYSFK